jgi:hypothetical protein
MNLEVFSSERCKLPQTPSRQIWKAVPGAFLGTCASGLRASCLPWVEFSILLSSGVLHLLFCTILYYLFVCGIVVVILAAVHLVGARRLRG